MISKGVGGGGGRGGQGGGWGWKSINPLKFAWDQNRILEFTPYFPFVEFAKADTMVSWFFVLPSNFIRESRCEIQSLFIHLVIGVAFYIFLENVCFHIRSCGKVSYLPTRRRVQPCQLCLRTLYTTFYRRTFDVNLNKKKFRKFFKKYRFTNKISIGLKVFQNIMRKYHSDNI